jgi:hypothetical protein
MSAYTPTSAQWRTFINSDSSEFMKSGGISRRRGVRQRSKRSLILRKTHNARDRPEPFHRMIGIYLSFRL